MPSPLSPSKSTLVLVTGATGWVGGHVCRALLDRGYSVRAAVRDPAAEAKVKFLTDMGCELVRVPDLLGDEGWEAAMAGCEHQSASFPCLGQLCVSFLSFFLLLTRT